MKLHLVSQKGQSSVYFIICIMVVLLAVSLVGGFGTLMSGDTPFPVADPPAASGTPNPTSSNSGASPSPTTATSSWDVVYKTFECKSDLEGNKYMNTVINGKGSTGGYISISIKNPDNSFKVIDTAKFNAPQSIYEVHLKNSDGFNNNSWRITIFEGGQLSNGKFQGGSEKASENGDPTAC